MSRADVEPDAAACAMAADLLGRHAALQFSPAGHARFAIVDEDATALARTLGAEMPPEPGEPQPTYVRVAFDPERVPSVGAYTVVTDDDGRPHVCCVLVVAGHGVKDLDVPGEPLRPGHALLAAWDVADLNSNPLGISDADHRERGARIDHDHPN